MHWGLLPVVTESMRHNCSFVKGRFTGDPSYEYEHTETKKVENQDGDKVDGAEEENIVCKVLSFGCTKLPPFSLIHEFGKQNIRGNVSKISVSLACY